MDTKFTHAKIYKHVTDSLSDYNYLKQTVFNHEPEQYRAPLMHGKEQVNQQTRKVVTHK